MMNSRLRPATIVLSIALSAIASPLPLCRAQLALQADSTLDAAALLLPANATYGRAINGEAYQDEALMTFGGFQYATWYHVGATDEDVYLARRDLAGGGWQVMDTGLNFVNGDASAWDAHNMISLGISGDGRMHISWDHHNNTLRYVTTAAGAATGSTWNSTLFGAERNSLNAGGAAAVGDVTYPRFIRKPGTNDIMFDYRIGSSGNGNTFLSTFNAATGTWNAPQQYINGTTALPYDDDFGNASNNRNAYINGLNFDATGRLHVTWTWREDAGGTNHDIMYAYSDDGGDTWLNNAGAVIGNTSGTVMNLNSPGVTVVPLNRGNTLMNQQGQTVDPDGSLHTIMWHKTDAAAPTSAFDTTRSAYFHYMRDPTTGAWSRRTLPTSRVVGGRPDIAYDDRGNLYAGYVSPGPGDPGGYYTSGDLVIATATKASGYQDWEIVYTDTRDFAGEPRIDQQRLLSEGVLSLFIQENNAAITGATGTPLHVMDFNVLSRLAIWAGDLGTEWATTGPNVWDRTGDHLGDAPFVAGDRAQFDDSAADFSVEIPTAVSTGGVTFRNTAAKPYTFTGAGIGGSGGLTVAGGGLVTLAGGANAYTGATSVTSGTLVLTGAAAITGSPNINVAAGATLNAAGTNAGGLSLNDQTLVVHGAVQGAVLAENDASVDLGPAGSVGPVTLDTGARLSGAGQVAGSVVANVGVVRIGGAGLPSSMQTPTQLVDDFSDGSLSEYTNTIVNDQSVGTANVTFSIANGRLQATYAGTAIAEQLLLLRDDVGLGVGQTLIADVVMPATAVQLDFGIAVSADATPPAASAGDADTRDLFDWNSVAVRPNGDNIRFNRSVNGAIDTTTGAATGVAETNVTAIYIRRNSPTQFTLGYTTGATSFDRTTVNYTATNVGTAIGFYTHLQSVGSLGALDNLRIVNPAVQVFAGETLTINGSATLSSGATLAFDALSPTIRDRLVVTGHLAAAGVLSLDLQAGAPTPALGDAIDLLDFASASGGFDNYDLPPLAAGLAWNVSKLINTGALEVVTDLDLDNNGFVDGNDFLALQRTAPDLITTWKTLFGSRLVTPTPVTAVPVTTLAMALISP